MSNNVYGYIRVSSRDQNEDRQVIAMHEYGIDDSHIYTDKYSGKDFNRPAYKKLIGILEPGDCMVIKSLDRLGRNYEEMLKQWEMIGSELHVSLVVLDMPLLNTKNEKIDLNQTVVISIMLILFSYMAEMERNFNHQRQEEGISAAKAKGVKFGRPPKERTAEFYELEEAYRRKEVTAAGAARRLGINRSTFLRWIEK